MDLADLPSEKMPEAEVALRLAFHLVSLGHVTDEVAVAIDGAQVKTETAVHFRLAEFLEGEGWEQTPAGPIGWIGTYSHALHPARLVVHASSGKGDVVASLRSGKRLRVECKKGPLVRSKSSAEYPLLREALGQLLTVEEVADNDLMAVAVPRSPKFLELAERWRKAPLVRRSCIRILVVARDGSVEGFEPGDLVVE
ncbi:MAG TPA: hypothetical protein VFF73_17595 [Planctomycetota bacterium]|nr:hypothetical protein [Planctomycetota bacterium]